MNVLLRVMSGTLSIAQLALPGAVWAGDVLSGFATWLEDASDRLAERVDTLT